MTYSIILCFLFFFPSLQQYNQSDEAYDDKSACNHSVHSVLTYRLFGSQFVFFQYDILVIGYGCFVYLLHVSGIGLLLTIVQPVGNERLEPGIVTNELCAGGTLLACDLCMQGSSGFQLLIRCFPVTSMTAVMAWNAAGLTRRKYS